MSASTIAPAFAGGFQASPAPARTNWIVSKRDDLVWFIGSALIGYLALGLMAAGFPITLIYLIWFLGVDGPHVVGTVTRTYFDRQERKRLGWWLWAVAPLMAIGPVMVALGQGALFFLLAVCWQHFHIAKQHVGFVMLWKAKNKERGAKERNLDKAFLLASTTLPLALFVIQTRLASWISLVWLGRAATAAYGVFALVYAIYQVRKFRAGLPMNAPKLLLLAALVPLQWLAFGHAASLGPNGIIRAGIALGLFHSFQYHRLMWFHNRNRYQVPEAREKFGLAAVLARGWGYYLAAAIGLHFLLSPLPQALFPAETVAAAIWGFAFTHYVLDSRIWRVRSDRELAAALRM